MTRRSTRWVRGPDLAPADVALPALRRDGAAGGLRSRARGRSHRDDRDEREQAREEQPAGTRHALHRRPALQTFASGSSRDFSGFSRLIETVAEGDLVAAYTRVSAVHTGDTFGFPGTGEPFEAEQMHLMRFADDGRIVEHWGVRDDAGMMRQAGPAPCPEPESGLLWMARCINRLGLVRV